MLKIHSFDVNASYQYIFLISYQKLFPKSGDGHKKIQEGRKTEMKWMEIQHNFVGRQTSQLERKKFPGIKH